MENNNRIVGETKIRDHLILFAQQKLASKQQSLIEQKLRSCRRYPGWTITVCPYWTAEETLFAYLLPHGCKQCQDFERCKQIHRKDLDEDMNRRFSAISQYTT